VKDEIGRKRIAIKVFELAKSHSMELQTILNSLSQFKDLLPKEVFEKLIWDVRSIQGFHQNLLQRIEHKINHWYFSTPMPDIFARNVRVIKVSFIFVVFGLFL
jgi:hypothetical protein